MYPNLNAELTRHNRNQSDLVNILNLNSSTVSDKMNGKRDFKLTECKEIIKKLFPKLTIDYLFATKNELEVQTQSEKS